MKDYSQDESQLLWDVNRWFELYRHEKQCIYGNMVFHLKSQ